MDKEEYLRMYIFNVLILAIFLFTAPAWAASAADAEKLIDAGKYSRAEKALKELINAEPKNARYHQLLGDAYRREGKLRDAIAEYETAKNLGGENAELYKSMGTTYKWLRQDRTAAEHYKKALKLKPNDREAKEDLEDLNISRGLTLNLMAGGWEADNTTEKYEGMLEYGGVDKMNLNAGYSYSKNTYYSRHKAYANGYYFYEGNSYAKAGVAYKDYNYPTGPTLQPDSNAYDKVPSFEAEVSHWFSSTFRGTFAYEFFRPSFLYDKDTKANNHKISAEAYYITHVDGLKLKLMYALLKDPDPDNTTIKGRGLNMPLGTVASSTSIKYRTQSLLGAGAEYSRSNYEAEIKYLPNRDLDSSYSWSVLAGFAYAFTDKVTGRLDYVHDKYSSKSSNSGKTANVYLASVFYKLDKRTDLGFGAKHIDLPTTNDETVFVTVKYKLGIGF